ncbi:hypothetical protein M3205_06255 [Cytobacillus firmus]|uniref:hypothetical protein n=1 Tax=Cytobacillus firmus TaxID=1399 RepID=UPI00203A4EE8|nr:hypothetical protein [Cytobacillus firmus]MCM3705330.1 hypothetical protein [Cytobacillus firmus]
MKTILILGVLFFTAPVLVASLLEMGIFSFAKGEVDTWITFWGSYLGAIVSASVVYFVAQLQIKKQQELQIEAIRIENENSTRREMKNFYLKNKLEKIEEMQNSLKKLATLNINLNNDLLTFAITKDAIDRGIKSNRNDDDPIERIYLLRTNLRKQHLEMTEALLKLNVLDDYIQGLSGKIFDLHEEFQGLYEEVRNCYYSDEKYKEYLSLPNERRFITDNSEIINRKISQLSFNDLQALLRSILNEIENYMK